MSKSHGGESRSAGTGMRLAPAEFETLPPLFSRWLDQADITEIPRELNATCMDCAMCSVSAAHVRVRSFNPRVKCCTYVPDLRNFQVGAILTSMDVAAHGRNSVEARIKSYVGVTPLGLAQPPTYTLIYKAAREGGANAFGRSPAMRCPHYIDERGGECGIWRHRNAVCATYFCKHTRGAVGKAFWSDVRNLLIAVEQDIAFWCAMEMGIEPVQLRQLIGPTAGSTSAPLETELVEQEARRYARELWGSWFGKEEAFFANCSRIASELSWSDITRIGGCHVQAFVAVAKDGLGQLRSQELPDYLTPARISARPLTHDASVVDTYSPCDPLVVPHRVLGLLHHFDGSRTADVLDRIDTAENIAFQPDLVRSLVDFHVLIETGGAKND